MMQWWNCPSEWFLAVSIFKQLKIMKNQYTAIGWSLLQFYNQHNR